MKDHFLDLDGAWVKYERCGSGENPWFVETRWVPGTAVLEQSGGGMSRLLNLSSPAVARDYFGHLPNDEAGADRLERRRALNDELREAQRVQLNTFHRMPRPRRKYIGGRNE